MSQCKSITEGGKQCRRKTLPGRRYCWQHEYTSTRILTLGSFLGIVLAIIGLWADVVGLGFGFPVIGLESNKLFSTTPPHINTVTPSATPILALTFTPTQSPTPTLTPTQSPTPTLTPTLTRPPQPTSLPIGVTDMGHFVFDAPNGKNINTIEHGVVVEIIDQHVLPDGNIWYLIQWYEKNLIQQGWIHNGITLLETSPSSD